MAGTIARISLVLGFCSAADLRADFLRPPVLALPPAARPCRTVGSSEYNGRDKTHAECDDGDRADANSTLRRQTPHLGLAFVRDVVERLALALSRKLGRSGWRCIAFAAAEGHPAISGGGGGGGGCACCHRSPATVGRSMPLAAALRRIAGGTEKLRSAIRWEAA
eukprot:SAG31_NODE_900_length_11140_cov_3.806086_4_plen_165_part_00